MQLPAIATLGGIVSKVAVRYTTDGTLSPSTTTPRVNSWDWGKTASNNSAWVTLIPNRDVSRWLMMSRVRGLPSALRDTNLVLTFKQPPDGLLSFNKDNLDLDNSVAAPLALYATPSFAPGQTVVTAPRIGLFETPISSPQRVPLSTSSVPQNARLYIKERPRSAKELRYTTSTSPVADATFEYYGGVADYVKGTGSFLLPSGTYTLRLATDGTSNGWIRVEVRQATGVLYGTYTSTPVPGCVCSEVTFTIPKGGYADITAGL